LKYFSILLLLASCGHSDHWEVSHIQTGNASYDSSKLVYPAQNPVSGVDLEILKVAGEMHAYLQVHSQIIPAYLGNPKEAFVTLYIDQQPFFGVAARHEGGQRLLLSPELQTLLFEALEKNKSVKIELEGFSAVVQPEDFPKYLGELSSPPFRNPFYLPVRI
jgi:hypothetical protein